MSESNDTPAKRKPFQFGLGTLLALTTIAAIFLGLARFAHRPGVGFVLALILFLPFFFFTRWFLRDGQRVARLGCFLSALIFCLGFAGYAVLIMIMLLILAVAGYK